MQKPETAYPFVALSALMNRGPFMIYNGQEYGEDAADSDNGKTSIFDYTYMPSMHCTDAMNRVSIFDFYRILRPYVGKSMVQQF